jgi:hypothetical protein
MTACDKRIVLPTAMTLFEPLEVVGCGLKLQVDADVMPVGFHDPPSASLGEHLGWAEPKTVGSQVDE